MPKWTVPVYLNSYYKAWVEVEAPTPTEAIDAALHLASDDDVDWEDDGGELDCHRTMLTDVEEVKE